MNFLDTLRVEKNATKAPVTATFDGLDFSAENDMTAAETANLRLEVAGVIAAWAETDDLDDDESIVERFDAMMIGIVDADKNGDLDDDELAVLDIAYNIAAEIFTAKGASDEDIDAMLNDGDSDAGENIHELIINTGADGEDEELNEINATAFDFDEDSDSAVLDATYKRKIAIRNGKKTIIRKRIAGRVRLTAKQKMAIKKMHRKSHSGKARMKRLKSLKRRKAMGL
ncbi:MAG: hypothetical protein IJR46_08225 [Neisseriaceae bacterium]|nr:hypothetical protein [Neisseriaceae bacterium]